MNERPALAVSGSNVTGEAAFSCALRLPTGIAERRSPPGQRGDLAALVAGLCAAHGVRPQDVAELRVDVGPGSYTGLRVAVTFARFVQRFGPVAVLAVDSLSLLATAALGREVGGRRLRPLLDARRERFHAAILSAGPPLRLLGTPQALPLADVLASAGPGDLFVVPAAVAAAAGTAIRAAGADVLVATGVAARDLFRPELELQSAAAADLEPCYLMGSYAEPD